MIRRWTDDVAIVAPYRRVADLEIKRLRREEPERLLGLNPVIVTRVKDARGRRFAHVILLGTVAGPGFREFQNVINAVYAAWRKSDLRVVEQRDGRKTRT